MMRENDEQITEHERWFVNMTNHLKNADTFSVDDEHERYWTAEDEIWAEQRTQYEQRIITNFEAVKQSIEGGILSLTNFVEESGNVLDERECQYETANYIPHYIGNDMHGHEDGPIANMVSVESEEIEISFFEDVVNEDEPISMFSNEPDLDEDEPISMLSNEPDLEELEIPLPTPHHRFHPQLGEQQEEQSRRTQTTSKQGKRIRQKGESEMNPSQLGRGKSHKSTRSTSIRQVNYGRSPSRRGRSASRNRSRSPSRTRNQSRGRSMHRKRSPLRWKTLLDWQRQSRGGLSRAKAEHRRHPSRPSHIFCRENEPISAITIPNGFYENYSHRNNKRRVIPPIYPERQSGGKEPNRRRQHKKASRDDSSRSSASILSATMQGILKRMKPRSRKDESKSKQERKNKSHEQVRKARNENPAMEAQNRNHSHRSQAKKSRRKERDIQKRENLDYPDENLEPRNERSYSISRSSRTKRSSESRDRPFSNFAENRRTQPSFQNDHRQTPPPIVKSILKRKGKRSFELSNWL